jgi:hypothetical protein
MQPRPFFYRGKFALIAAIRTVIIAREVQVCMTEIYQETKVCLAYYYKIIYFLFLLIHSTDLSLCFCISLYVCPIWSLTISIHMIHHLASTQWS